MKKLSWHILLATQALMITAASADDVTFGGRNFMEGELKHMERGKLYFKTPATDTIYIEWDDVGGITSTQTLEVELQSGKLLYGSLQPSEVKGQAMLRPFADADRVPIPIQNIVRIQPIEDTFLSRFDGSFSAGLNLNKASSYRQFDLGLELEYVTRRYDSEVTASSIATNSDGSESSSQSRLKFASNRKLANRWRTGAKNDYSVTTGVSWDI